MLKVHRFDNNQEPHLVNYEVHLVQVHLYLKSSTLNHVNGDLLNLHSLMNMQAMCIYRKVKLFIYFGYKQAANLMPHLTIKKYIFMLEWNSVNCNS